MKPKAVYLLRADAFSAVFSPADLRRIATLVEVIAPPLTAETWSTCTAPLHDVALILTGWGAPRMNAPFLSHFPALRAVFNAAGTVKHLTSDELWARQVRVTSAAAMNAIPVAELTLSQILFCLKHGWHRVIEGRNQRAFPKVIPTPPGALGSTVGLISLSRTGQLVAEHLQRFDLKVIAYDPVIAPERATQLGVRLCPLDEVFALADVVSCHAPLLPTTKHLLRARHFLSMKLGANFINTARGAVIHEAELLSVLTTRPDLFACLDVTDPEPPVAGSPLFSLPNVVVTPHIAGSLGPECHRLGRMMADELERYIAGRPLQGEITAAQLAVLA
jgi:phosphoglycerate dehydrogenase-like enzyme